MGAYSELSCNVGNRYTPSGMKLADLSYVALSELCSLVCLASVFSKVADRVPYVLKACNPFKIVNSVVCRVVVNVVDLQIFSFSMQKRQSYDSVNLLVFAIRLPFDSKPDIKIPRLVRALLENFHSLGPTTATYAAYASKCRNLIVKFMPGNRFPNFFHIQSPLVDARMKVHGNRYGNRLSGATLAMQGAL